jgi:hydroxymethylglutaryl-CoA synthase
MRERAGASGAIPGATYFSVGVEMTDVSKEGFGILAVGAYLPRLRLDRAAVAAAHRWMAPSLKALARGTRSMANWDEDVVTMAVEAARAARRNFPALKPARLTLASTTLPFADRLNASVVSAALGIAPEALAADAAGSMRAGSSALLRALQEDSRHSELIVASERLVPKPASAAELAYGDGAAAVLVGHGKPLAIALSTATETWDFVDHYRESGHDSEGGWEERWVRDEGYLKLVPPVVLRALSDAGIAPRAVDRFILSSTLQRVDAAVAKQIGIAPEAVAASLFEQCGCTGTAHPLVLLARELSDAPEGRTIVLAQFGNGCDVVVLRTTGTCAPTDASLWLTPGRIESNYLKYLSFTGQVHLDWGMRSEMDNKNALSAAWRGHDTVNAFMAGSCTSCGTVQFPSSRVCVNPACGGTDTQVRHRLSEEPARVLSYTSDWLSYKPCPPFLFGHVRFESGARVLMEFTDCEEDGLAVDAPVRMVFRIKETDRLRGFRRYFWKATTLSERKEQ